jgi:hypothetical protein
MGSALVLEDRIGAIALDGEGHLFEAANLGWGGGQDLGCEATLLRVASQHLEQVAREQSCLIAPRPGADLDQDVLGVVRVALDHRQADLLAELLEPPRRVGDQLAQLPVVAVLGEHLGGPLEIVAELRVLACQLVRRLEIAVLTPDLGVALAVGDHRRVRHLALQLREATLDLVDQLLDHAS